MAPELWDRFARRKWCTPLRVSLPSISGDRLCSFEWPDAILDTGAPAHVLPGIAPTCADRTTARQVERVQVSVLVDRNGGRETVELPYSNYFPIPLGGIELQPLFRLEFWAAFHAARIPMLGDAPFVLMDIPHPVISFGQCVEEGGRFVFEHNRFSVR